MSKRKALSAEEKSIKMLELFHETCDVYQLKDLERLAPAEKGIVVQSVKSVLQELVDNGEVRSEKISGSNYYWAFPADALHKVKLQIEANETQTLQLEKKIETVQKQLETCEANSANAIHAEVLEKEVETLKKERNERQQKLSASIADVDYDEIASKEKDTKEILDAANRWTDNIFSIKSWCKRKFCKEEKEMNKAFGIPEELDYLET